jgi:hypothetical protein
LARLTGELERQSAQQHQAEIQVGEKQEAAHARVRKLEADWAAAVERNVHFEEELVNIRRERDDLNVQLKIEQRTSADAAHQAAELQRRLERNSAELQRVTAEAGKKRSDRERVETESREQVEKAKELARKLDAAWTAATERSRRFEGEVSELRQERAELQNKLAAAQREAARFKAIAADLETRANSSREPAPGTRKVEVHRPDFSNGSPRRDTPQSNGHRKAPTEPSLSAVPTSSNGHREDAVHPAIKGQDTKRAPVEPRPAMPPSRHTGDLQQYNFGDPSGVPPRNDIAASKKRLQP